MKTSNSFNKFIQFLPIILSWFDIVEILIPIIWDIFWHFVVGFVRLVISDVDCQLQTDVLYHLGLQDFYCHCGTSEISAVQSDRKVDPSNHALLMLEAIWETM